MSDNLLQEMRDHILKSQEQEFLDKTIFVGEKVFDMLSEKYPNTKDHILHRDITIVKHPYLDPKQICSFDEDIVNIMKELFDFRVEVNDEDE